MSKIAGGQVEVSNRVAEDVYTAAQEAPFTRDAQPAACRAWWLVLDGAWTEGSVTFHYNGGSATATWTTEATGSEWRDTMLAQIRTIPGLEAAEMNIVDEWLKYVIYIPYDMTTTDVMTITDGMDAPSTLTKLAVPTGTNAAGLTLLLVMGPEIYGTGPGNYFDCTGSMGSVFGGGNDSLCELVCPGFSTCIL
jgi:hypothetical protein